MAGRTKSDEIFNVVIDCSFVYTFVSLSINVMNNKFFKCLADLTLITVSLKYYFSKTTESVLVVVPIEQFPVLLSIFRIFLNLGISVFLIPPVTELSLRLFVVCVILLSPTPPAKAGVCTAFHLARVFTFDTLGHEAIISNMMRYSRVSRVVSTDSPLSRVASVLPSSLR